MRRTFTGTSLVLSGSIITGLAAVGCSDLPGDKKTQGAVIGGVTGVAAGAIIGGHGGRLIGGLLGGALGAGGGYLIGAQLDKQDSVDRDRALDASRSAEARPATAADARAATTADLNGDGYVTMDEVVAMRRAGFSDTEMIVRLQRTGMFFDLTDQQQTYLRNNGVSQYVIDQMHTMNSDARRRATHRLGTTSAPPPAPSYAAPPPPSPAVPPPASPAVPAPPSQEEPR